MDWIKGMNNAINYVEDHLDQPIQLEEVSKVAMSSSYHFQRLFHMLTDMTITEYIRKRRLTRAVKDLAQDGNRVIDVALRYGYETPESFSKAFKKYHGLSPSLAKKRDHQFKAMLPLRIQVTLEGSESMDYKIMKKAPMKFVGIKKNVTTIDGQNFEILPKFWEAFFTMDIAKEMMKQEGELGIIGACYNNSEATQSFDYMIGVEANDTYKNDNLEVLSIPETQWAVFPSRGPLPSAIQTVWKRIFNEFFPATEYEHARLPELEIYYHGDTNSDDYYCEVWIPITKK